MDEKGTLFRFSSFELIPSQWTLRRGDKKLKFNEDFNQADFKVLCCLADRAPDVVPREDLMSAAGWGPRTKPNSLDQSIHKLRKILGQSSHIQRIRGVGYGLTLQVTRQTQVESSGSSRVPPNKTQIQI